MKILLDQNNIGLFLGQGFEVFEDRVVLDDGAVCTSLSSSNSTVVDCWLPVPPVSGAWRWENGTWVVVNQHLIDSFLREQAVATNARNKAKRSEAYAAESDPLFFKAQRGESTLEEWKNKVEEITVRYPYTPVGADE